MADENGNGNGNGHDEDAPDLRRIVDILVSQGAMIRVLMNAIGHQRDLLAKMRLEIEELKRR